MNQKQFLLTLLVATFSAFLGGTFGVWLLMPPSVLAQDEPQKVIEAQEFRVVDSNGTTRATLGFNSPWGSVCGSHHLVENTQHVFPHDLGHILTRVSSLQERLSDILIFTCVFDPLDIDRVASPV